MAINGTNLHRVLKARYGSPAGVLAKLGMAMDEIGDDLVVWGDHDVEIRLTRFGFDLAAAQRGRVP